MGDERPHARFRREHGIPDESVMEVSWKGREVSTLLTNGDVGMFTRHLDETGTKGWELLKTVKPLMVTCEPDFERILQVMARLRRKDIPMTMENIVEAARKPLPRFYIGNDPAILLRDNAPAPSDLEF
jgi:hypothetical protein